LLDRPLPLNPHPHSDFTLVIFQIEHHFFAQG
jgi:hypothetical protein